MDSWGKLQDLGYSVQDIKLKEKNKVRYIKAKDKHGRTLYIDLEEEEISLKSTDVVLGETKNIIAPNSLIRGNLSCVEPEARGIAVECSGGVCILSRENKFNLEEKNFSGPTSFAHHLTPSSYPLIKLKEITSNPLHMERCLETCSERISASEMEFCNNVMQDIPKNLRELNCRWEGFMNAFHCKKKELLESIAELEKYKKDYERRGDTCSHNYKTILWNLKYRREKLYSFIVLSKNMVVAKNTLLGISEELEENCKWLHQELADLKFVITPDCGRNYI